jgi:uncharacterized protein involved in exopolysaccharide biosynthesis
MSNESAHTVAARLTETASGEDRFEGREVLKSLWRGRVPLMAITLTITGIVAASAFLIPPRFEATVLLMPVADIDSSDKLGGLGSAVAQLGGLASLAGLSSSGNTLKVEAEATLESEALTVRYIRDNNLLPILYRSQWDPVRLQWTGKKAPTVWKANRYFRDNIRTVTDNARTGLITLKISWRDPYEAAKWANDLVSSTNEYLRNRAIVEAQRNVAFLEEQAKSNPVVSIQATISVLTENQLKKLMLARSRDQYGLKVLDPATVPEKQSFPRPAIWIPGGFFFGLFLAVIFVLMRAPITTSVKSPSGV